MTNKTSPTTGNESGESNPLGEIINAIPWELRLLDIDLVDTLKDIVHNFDPKLEYSNKHLMLLLDELVEHKFITKLVTPYQGGNLILIKRI